MFCGYGEGRRLSSEGCAVTLPKVEKRAGETVSSELYFEDLHPGMKFNSSRRYKVTAEEIKQFAENYDPQPFHLDEAAGES